MAAAAVRLLPTCAPRILTLRDRFKMGGIDAASIPADVVKIEALRDRASPPLVGPPMSRKAHFSVTLPASPKPLPASVWISANMTIEILIDGVVEHFAALRPFRLHGARTATTGSGSVTGNGPASGRRPRRRRSGGRASRPRGFQARGRGDDRGGLPARGTGAGRLSSPAGSRALGQPCRLFAAPRGYPDPAGGCDPLREPGSRQPGQPRQSAVPLAGAT